MIHSENPATIMRFAARVPVLRVAVNAPNSTGSAGVDANLAPSTTLGTGFAGRSSIGESLEPRHLVNWTRVAYNADAAVPFGDFTGLVPWERPAWPVPRYPLASKVRISTDEELHQLVLRVLRLADNAKLRRDLISGRVRFRLASGAERCNAEHRVDKGAVTERVVAAAAQAGARLVLGRRAVLTPLAKERARALGVAINRER